MQLICSLNAGIFGRYENKFGMELFYRRILSSLCDLARVMGASEGIHKHLISRNKVFRKNFDSNLGHVLLEYSQSGLIWYEQVLKAKMADAIFL